MKIKLNDNLIAIFTYINNIEYRIDLDDFIQWCIDYEYYKELYLHWHLIKDLIKFHNDNLDYINKKRLERKHD